MPLRATLAYIQERMPLYRLTWDENRDRNPSEKFVESGMTRRIVFAAGAAALLAATPAMAQQVSGLYVGAGAGANFLQGNGLNQDDYDVGPAGNLYVGYGFGNGFRTDLEASIRENSHDGNNHQTTYGLMANGYYDFDFGSPFVPYIGAGVGLALVNADFNQIGRASCRERV
jgi:OOP family OmpA-OmpF porin